MGALLAFHLAKNHPDTTRGVIVLSNAMWLKSPWPTWGLKLVDRLRVPDFWIAKSAPDLGDREQRALHLTYNAQPVRTVISLLRAGESLAEQLQGVKAPTLILHGALDSVAPVSNAWRVAVRLGAVQKKTVIFQQSHHILTRDIERDAVRRRDQSLPPHPRRDITGTLTSAWFRSAARKQPEEGPHDAASPFLRPQLTLHAKSFPNPASLDNKCK